MVLKTAQWAKNDSSVSVKRRGISKGGKNGELMSYLKSQQKNR